MRAPQARSRASLTLYGGTLLIRGPLCTRTALGPGSAVHRTGRRFASPGERCTASGIRHETYCFTLSQDDANSILYFGKIRHRAGGGADFVQQLQAIFAHFGVVVI